MSDQPTKFPTVDDLEIMRAGVGNNRSLPPHLALQVLDLVDRLLQDTGPHCHFCGCTESFACDEGPGGACAWAKPGVCSSCIDQASATEPAGVAR